MSEERSIVILAGGVGAAKFIDGLANIIDQSRLKIIVNTGDDIELFGLHMSPDLDIITYTLAGVIDKEKGWGFSEESFNSLSILKRYYNFDWFNAGDKDLATHIFRTDLLKRGFNKQEATEKICKKLGVQAQIIPMSNEPFQTNIVTPQGEMHFEEFYIKHQCNLPIWGIKFLGKETAKPAHRIIELIKDAYMIIISPSNPIVSIGTILSIDGIIEVLKERKTDVYGISPIISGKTVKGPADKLMEYCGLEISSVGVARYYKEFLGNFIIDNQDSQLCIQIEQLGIKCYTYDTLMTNLQKKKELAQFVLSLSEGK